MLDIANDKENLSLLHEEFEVVVVKLEARLWNCWNFMIVNNIYAKIREKSHQ